MICLNRVNLFHDRQDKKKKITICSFNPQKVKSESRASQRQSRDVDGSQQLATRCTVVPEQDIKNLTKKKRNNKYRESQKIVPKERTNGSPLNLGKNSNPSA